MLTYKHTNIHRHTHTLTQTHINKHTYRYIKKTHKYKLTNTHAESFKYTKTHKTITDKTPSFIEIHMNIPTHYHTFTQKTLTLPYTPTLVKKQSD